MRARHVDEATISRADIFEGYEQVHALTVSLTILEIVCACWVARLVSAFQRRSCVAGCIAEQLSR